MSEQQSSGEARRASCRCGQLAVVCEGAPMRVSVCHCLACQQRSGSAFAAQARFAADRVQISGTARLWVSGNEANFFFCPECGSTVYYTAGNSPDWIAVAIGAFADPHFPPPRFSVYEERMHQWVSIAGDDIEHID